MNSSINGKSTSVAPEGTKVLTGKLLKFEQGIDWSIPDDFTNGQAGHIGNIHFYQQRTHLHTSTQTPCRIQVELFPDRNMVPFYPFEGKMLTYISHKDGTNLNVEGGKSYYTYWVQAVCPQDGTFFFFLVACEPRSRNASG